jgi:hypothetical protein
LKGLGFARVRPLQGGFDEWVRLGFPVDEGKPLALAV